MSEGAEDNLYKTMWDKMKHPVSGTFASAWLIWNWQIIPLFIHGYADPKSSIEEIQNTYLICARSFHLIWGPLLSTAIFLLVGPFFRNGVISWNKLVEVWRGRIDAWIEGTDVVSKVLLDSANFKIDDLNGQVTSMMNQANSARQDLAELTEAFKGITADKGTIVDSQGNGHLIKDLWLENRGYATQLQSVKNQYAKLNADYQIERMKNKTADPPQK